MVRKLKYNVNKEKHTKYTPKHYDTPKDIGIKWQMDVKVVPKDCYVGQIPDKFYQYTIIDEASRERFTYTMKTDRTHPLDIFLNSLNIQHKLIKPRTPRHNGKVERSHRNDQQRFYSYLKFYSYDDLLKQMKSYLKRSNNIPMQSLNWLTPLETRHNLEQKNNIL